MVHQSWPYESLTQCRHLQKFVVYKLPFNKTKIKIELHSSCSHNRMSGLDNFSQAEFGVGVELLFEAWWSNEVI